MKKSPVSPAAMRKAGGKPVNEKMATTGPIVKGGVSKGNPVIKPERRWEVEDAMRTLVRAEELRSDAKLMADVKAHAAEQAKKMAAVCKK